MGLGPFTPAEIATLTTLARTSYSSRRELIDAAVLGLAITVGIGVVAVESAAGDTAEEQFNNAIASLPNGGTVTVSSQLDLTNAAAAIDVPPGINVVGLSANAEIVGDAGTTAFAIQGGSPGASTQISQIQFTGLGTAIDLDSVPAGDNGSLVINQNGFDSVGVAVSWDTPLATASFGQLAITSNLAVNGTSTQLDIQGLFEELEICNNEFDSIVGGAISIGDDTMAGAIQRRGIRICDNDISNLTIDPPNPLSAITVDGVGVLIRGNYIENVVGVTGPTRAIEARSTFGEVSNNTVVGAGGGGWIAIDLDGVVRDRSVTVTGTDDGDYTITLTAVDPDGSLVTETHTHPAAGQTETQIRDALEALVDAGALAAADDLATDGLTLVPADARAVAVAVDAPNGNLSLSSARPTGYGMTVEGNVIQCEGGGAGIQIANEETKILGNWIYEPSGNGIQLTSEATRRIEIARNTLVRSTAGDAGILLRQGDDYAVEDNAIFGFDDGVLLQPTLLNASLNRVSVQRNKVVGPADNCIEVDAGADGVSLNDSIIGNNILQGGDIGVQVVGSVTTLTITPNVASGQGTAEFNIPGTPTALRREGGIGSDVAAGNFALSAGWGSTATVTPAAGSNDVRGSIDVLCQGAGIAANPTITFTATNGQFPAAPFAFVVRNDNEAPVDVQLTVTTTTSTMVITFNDTPVTATTYTFLYRQEQ